MNRSALAVVAALAAIAINSIAAFNLSTTTRPHGIHSRLGSFFLKASESERIFDENDDEDAMPPSIDGFGLDDDFDYNQRDLESMTVAQLKQQLRLRNRKVSGNKSQLIERLLGASNKSSPESSSEVEIEGHPSHNERVVKTNPRDERRKDSETSHGSSAKVDEAKARGADIVDVSDYIDAEEVGKSFRASTRIKNADVVDADIEDDQADESTSPYSSEVWGEDARIVEDYEGRSVVVDGLSRTIIEYKGSNDTLVQAYVVGSRDALKNFLKGGEGTSDATSKKNSHSSMEEKVYAIQQKREIESRRGLISDNDAEGMDDAGDPGSMYSTIERDYGDFGAISPTGAQLSSSEVQGVLLLSDVYGPFTDNTQALADKIAFECQPIVVLAPDMFRGKAWTNDPVEDSAGVPRNEDGNSYDEWRKLHNERRVDVDIRAAAAVLRERYAVSSIAVWGTCYGGGRALEAASAWYPGGPASYYEDEFGDRQAPPHVDPIACISWYPTRYNARKLFGKTNEGFRTFEDGRDRRIAVMAIFAEIDDLQGATPEDAVLLKKCLEDDPRISDFMVKVFPGQKHGFAHAKLGVLEEFKNDCDSEGRFQGEDYGAPDGLVDTGGDAEVACLLSTAFMESYTRTFLPTVGTPIRDDEDARWSTLEMEGYQPREVQEVRAELERDIANYEDMKVDLTRMPRSMSPLLEGEGSDKLQEIENERERIRQKIIADYDISPDDDDATFDAKVAKARADGALDEMLLEAYFDEASGGYW
ncbi:hypothetical protein THAOC_35708 [Thalassiosira oceanica]|uniref:SAP domain-containing protein n=1 Tax=Thalassiosira oceanica TaxID=159749 RepID=K0R0I6_THAOC|nr:hypothetical protein THAOC_35708 [Thalassiosira oceanica]|eukprot:EJK45678.1 hypothetical protein THAOC_35708 [Thalassiosira oceanica]